MNNLPDKLRDIADQLERQSRNEVETGLSDEMKQFIQTNYIRPIQESRILKNSEIAKILHLSPTTVGTMVKKGIIDSTPDGKITEYHLWKYLTNHKSK